MHLVQAVTCRLVHASGCQRGHVYTCKGYVTCCVVMLEPTQSQKAPALMSGACCIIHLVGGPYVVRTTGLGPGACKSSDRRHEVNRKAESLLLCAFPVKILASRVGHQGAPPQLYTTVGQLKQLSWSNRLRTGWLLTDQHTLYVIQVEGLESSYRCQECGGLLC